jgi:hypothetical protein
LPAAELAVWLVPGYLVLLLYLHVNPLRSKQSYEWFFQAAGLGILSYAVASVLSFGWRHSFGLLPPWFPWLGAATVTRWWSSHFAFTNSGLWVLAIAASPLVATCATWGRQLFDAAQTFVEKASPESPPSDIFLFRCRQLEKKLVIVTVDGGKVYVGFLTDFTTDPDESDRYIEIVPIMSGRRQIDTGLVEFTTPYITSNTEPTDRDLQELVVRRAILIPVKKVSTFAPFDVELHTWFKEQGLVKGKFEVDEEAASDRV